MTKRAIIAAVAVVLMAAGCGGNEDVGTPNPGGSGGIVGNVGGSGGGGTGGGGTGGTGGTGGNIPEPVCGNSVVEGDEACDDGEDNSDNAPDACRTDCTEARCGDGVEDTGETCDDGNLADGDGCSATCQLEYTCGDGIREFTEECDGADLAGQTCADFGHNSGDLACATDCTFDSSACATVEICDNGIDDDGDMAVDCEDTDCAGDIVACPTCGDGVINVDGEDCDGEELGGVSCTSLGFASGTVSCSDVCILDTTGCVPFEDCATPGDEDGNGLADCDDPACSDTFECPTCGNGIIQQGEECEGSPPPQANCQDNGFDTGNMICDPVTCQISTAQCRNYYCGDAAVEGPEECDDGNNVAGDGCTNCMIDGETCTNPLLITDADHRDPVTGVYTFSGNTAHLTRKFSAPTCSSFSTGEPEAIVKFTAPVAGAYVIDMETVSPYDDLFYVWDTACGAGSTEIACKDTGNVTVNLTAGQEIFIIATGYGSLDDDSGPFTLVIEPPATCGDGFVNADETCDTGTTVHSACVACELEVGYACDTTGCWTTTCGDNVIEGHETCEDGNTIPGDGCTNCRLDGDSCDNPLFIDASHLDTTTGIWTFTGDTSTMSRSFAAPSCNSTNAEPEAVIKFTAPGTGVYSIDMITTGVYDDLFYVWSGACGVGSPEIACKDTGSQSVNLTGGQDIYIVATGFGSLDDDSGPFTLTVTPLSMCGNGVIEGTETCDLGDVVDGDGCSSSCQLEAGWTCDATSCRQTICGDGIIEGTETCEDGNTIPNDGCTNCNLDGDSCLNPLVIDSSYRDPVTGIWTIQKSTTPMNSTYGSATCGASAGERDMVLEFTAPAAGVYDFALDFVPYMDDMLYIWEGGCGPGVGTEVVCSDPGTGTLTLAAGQTIYIVVDGYGNSGDDSHGPFILTIEADICGDGYVSGAETCDIGDDVSGDGCSSTCQLEEGYACDATTCWTTTCGDGVREGLEACDDGNTLPGDGCNPLCKFEGDTCADAYPFDVSHRDPATGLWTLQADTTQMNADYAGTCAGSTGEPDMVVAFTAPYAGSYRIDLATTGVYDDMFYVWDGVCGNGSPQLACVDTGATTQTLTAGQQIYIVVTGYGAPNDDFGPFTLTVQETACGNGLLTSGEACDDGNLIDGDGCDSTCQVETGFACDSAGCWANVCGDSRVGGTEHCDDGNNIPGDGCDACVTEGDTCATAPDVSTMLDPTTGVWTFTGSTAGMTSDFVGSCDPSGEPDVVVSFTAPAAGKYAFEYVLHGRDGLLYALDGPCAPGATELFCSAAESSNQTEWGAVDMTANQTIHLVLGGEGTAGSDSGHFTFTVRQIACGDGVVDLGETCDDGNTTPGDGCDATCFVEWGVEVEPNDTIATANPLGYGVDASIDPSLDVDFFSVDLTAGVTYVFQTATTPFGNCNSVIATDDTTITLRNAAGTSLGSDGDSGPGYCSRLQYTAVTTGTHYLEVKGYNSSTLIPNYYVWWSEL